MFGKYKSQYQTVQPLCVFVFSACPFAHFFALTHTHPPKKYTSSQLQPSVAWVAAVTITITLTLNYLHLLSPTVQFLFQSWPENRI